MRWWHNDILIQKQVSVTVGENSMMSEEWDKLFGLYSRKRTNFSPGLSLMFVILINVNIKVSPLSKIRAFVSITLTWVLFWVWPGLLWSQPPACPLPVPSYSLLAGTSDHWCRTQATSSRHIRHDIWGTRPLLHLVTKVLKKIWWKEMMSNYIHNNSVDA